MNRLESNVEPAPDLRSRNGRPMMMDDVEDTMKPSQLRLILGLVVVGLVIALAAGLIPRFRQRHALIQQTQQLAISTVSVVSAAPANGSEALALPAEIHPWIEAPIYARASGYLKKWYVDIGTRVTNGEILAEIDTPDLDQDLAHARAEVTQAEASFALSKTTAARWTELLKTSSVSEQENAERQADLALRVATVEAAHATARRLEELKSFSHITAPFEGTITARRIDVGELVKADSGRELFRLAQTHRLRVLVRVPQVMAHGISVGQSAEVTLPEGVNRVFTGKIIHTSGAIDTDSRTLLTEIELDNEKEEVLSGSFAQVKLGETKMEAPLTLPANTLLFRAEGPVIGIVGNDGRVELHKVSLGRDFGPYIEITHGVSTSDKVILNPADSLVSGVPVRVVAAPENIEAK